jgi:hypothetical protein
MVATLLHQVFTLYVFTVFVSPMTSLNITAVPSGIVITDRQELYSARSYVEVFVTIRDNRESKFIQDVNELCYKLRLQLTQTNVSSSTIDVLRHRLAILEERVHLQHHRPRRGLIDIIGNVAHVLFGTARDADVTALGNAVQKLGGATQGVIKTQDRSLAIVNKMSTEYNKLQKHVNNINRNLQMHTEALQHITDAMQQFEIVNRMSHVLSLIESQLYYYFNSVERLHDARVTSTMGKVTEDVIAPAFLQEVLNSVRNHKQLPLYWYYQALHVDYIFEYDDQLICKVHIPILDDEVFTLYNVQSFPIKGSSPNDYLRVYHDVQIALSSVNGDVLFTEDCIGTKPVVSSAAARFDVDNFQCIHGLLLNDDVRQKTCPVEHLSSIDPSYSIKEIGYNKFVGFTGDNSYIYRCPNAKPQLGKLLSGVYLIEIDPECALDTPSFLIRIKKSI